MINKKRLMVCSGISALVMAQTGIGLYKNDKKINHEEEICLITKITNNLDHQINAIKNNNSNVKDVKYIEDYNEIEYYAYIYDNEGHLIKTAVNKKPTSNGLEIVDENILISIYKGQYPALKILYMNKDELIVEEKVLKLEKKY